MYSDQTNPGGVDLAVACAAVCLSCGLVEVALFCFHAPGASMLALLMTELGSVAALVNMMTHRKLGFVGSRRRKAPVSSDAMTVGEKALMTKLRFRPIAVVQEFDGWRPAGSLPHSASRADFDAIIRDGFATIDSRRNLLRIGRD